MRVIHFSNDLMMAATVRSAAQRVGGNFVLVGNHDQLESVAMPNSIDQESDWLFVDLQDSKLVWTQLKTWLGQSSLPPQQIILYAQHVNEQILEEAREEKVGQVLTRGQFFQRMNRWTP